MVWRRILIVLAAVVTLVLSIDMCLRIVVVGEFVHLADSFKDTSDWTSKKYFIDRFVLPETTGGTGICYPFIWQHAQRERLKALRLQQNQMPTANDELAPARFELYADDHANEHIFLEGIRREPHNALYHYKLADLYLKQCLKVKGTTTDKKTGAIHYDYTMTDRRKLDMAMHEVAIGSQLPLHYHESTLLQAQWNAMPPVRDLLDHYRKTTVFTAVLSCVQFPEFGFARNLANANGFYLRLLLSEGKRAEAEPFLHTGEHLVVQISNDDPPSFMNQLVAVAVGSICKKHDAFVCRSFGLTHEAATIEAHQDMLIGKLQAWKVQRHQKPALDMNALIHDHAGMMAAMLLPTFTPPPAGMITKNSLAPSRLLDYVLIERAVATLLSLFAFLLLAYAGLKYGRWKLSTLGPWTPTSIIDLTSMDWARIVGYGLLLPLALYLLYIAIPALSWRDYGILVAKWRFGIALGVFTLWTLIVPTTIAAGAFLRRSIAAGLLPVDQLRHARFSRLLSTVMSAIWCGLAPIGLLLPICWALLAFVRVRSPFNNYAQIGLMCLWGLLMLAVPLLPAIWARKRADIAPHHLAMARTMITVYAVMTLFFAALVPVCAAFEHHYVKTDRIGNPVCQNDRIGLSNVESQLAIQFQGDVREGATKLGIPWE